MEKADENLHLANKRYNSARHKLSKHPHAAKRAQKAVAAAALVKLNALRTNKTEAKKDTVAPSPHAILKRTKSAVSGLDHNVLKRSHSIINRFNPGVI